MNIQEYLSQFDLDVRKTGDARFMDQKVTPDVLCIVSDCILQFVEDDTTKEFNTKDIWESDYAAENVINIFNKPDLSNKKARSEYDKFFAQPLRCLAYAQVLSLRKEGTRNIFKIENEEILKYISIKERNSLQFLILYLEKVLRDSQLWTFFDTFFKSQNTDNFQKMKEGFKHFLYEHTNINSTNQYEPGRIFTKIINPLANSKRVLGTKGGFLSRDVITYDELMYNRKNWKDIRKLKSETRTEYERRAQNEVATIREAYSEFTEQKAKRMIKDRYGTNSEVADKLNAGLATQVHHIFSKSDFPQLEAYLENLILLTATQHSTKAHPNNNTRLIDKEYQLVCLLEKHKTIEKSTEQLSDGFYSKEDYIFVLNTGIDPEEEFQLLPYSDIKHKLINEYHKS